MTLAQSRYKTKKTLQNDRFWYKKTHFANFKLVLPSKEVFVGHLLVASKGPKVELHTLGFASFRSISCGYASNQTWYKLSKITVLHF